MKLIGKEFIKDYLDLTLFGVDSKSFSTIVFLETIAAVFTLISVCFFGLLIQLMLDKSALNSSTLTQISQQFSSVIWLNDLDHFELILLISIASTCVGLAALHLEFSSLKFIRKTARKAYSKSLSKHLIAFRESPDYLSLSKKSLKNFKSSFTIDAHITFIALEAILKGLRPIVYIVVFSIAVLILQASALFIILLFIAVCAPFTASLNKETLSSAKGVLGEQRKKVYAELISYVDKIDSYEYRNSKEKPNNETFLPSNFSLMLDSFDSWKLSSDSANYTLQTLKVIGVHLAIISIGWAAYLDDSLEITSFVLLGFIIFKLLLSIINLLTRFTVLSRLFPVVNRYLTVVKEISGAKRVEETPLQKTQNTETPENIWIGIATSQPIKKSEVGLLTKQLRKSYPNFNLANLATQNHGAIGDYTHQRINFRSILDKFILEAGGETSDNFKQFLKKNNVIHDNSTAKIEMSIDPEMAWKRASPEMRVMLNLLILIYDRSVDYIICKPAYVNALKTIMETNTFTSMKLIITFDQRIRPTKGQPYNIVLTLPKKPQDQTEQLL